MAWDFSHVIDEKVLNEPPTDKQVYLVYLMCRALNYDDPQPFTKPVYTQFISDHIEEYENWNSTHHFINTFTGLDIGGALFDEEEVLGNGFWDIGCDTPDIFDMRFW